MEDDILKKMKRRNKAVVNLTIDADLKDRLETYKKKHHIKQLSPMVNVMLIDWLNKQEDKEKKS